MPTLRGLTELEAQALGLPSGTCEVTSRGAKTATSYSPGRWRGAKTYLLPPDPANPGKLRHQMHIGRDVHYEDDGGNWRTIDLDWRADPANPGEFVTDRNDIYTRVTRFGVAVWDRKRRIGVRWSTTVRPTTGGRRATFPKDGLEWSWSATTSGLKLESEPVASLRGPRTYEWRYLIVDLNTADGFDLTGTFTPDEAGNLVRDGIVTPRAFVIGANRVRYECGPWQTVPGKTRAVSFDFDDTTLPPEARPYVIDPNTTFPVAASADDGLVGRHGSTYPPTTNYASEIGATAGPERSFASGTYSVYQSLFRLDTSVVPDTATVNGAALRLYVSGKADTNGLSVVMGWINPGLWPIDATDYAATPETNAHAGTPIASVPTGGQYDFVLANAAANVSKTGYTAVRAAMSEGTPTGYNYLTFAFFDHATQPEPQLILDYTDGAGPTPVTYTVTLSVAAASVATVTRKHTRTRTLSAIIATVPTLATRKTFRKALAAVATGLATLARTVTFRRKLAAAMLGAATMPASGAKQQALSVVMTASATLTRLATFRRTLSVTATALPKLSKRMFVRLSVQAAVTAALSRARLRTRALAAVAGALAGMAATYAKGTGFVMRRSLWRAYNLFARTKKDR